MSGSPPRDHRRTAPWRARLPVAVLLLAGALAPTSARGEDTPPVPAAPAGEPRGAGESGPRDLPAVPLWRLGLPEAVAMALRNNLGLAAAGYGPGTARASLDEASALYDHLFTTSVFGGETRAPVQVFGAPDGIFLSDEDRAGGGMGLRRLLPTGGSVSLDAATDRTLSNARFPRNPAWASSLALTVRQPLLRGMGREYTEAGVRFAEDSLDLAALELRSRAESLVRQVEVTYWALVNARGQAEVQKKSLSVARDLLRIAEARLAAGAGTQVDVAQAESGVALREVDLLRAENEVANVEETLRGLLRPRPGHERADEPRVEPTDDPAAALPDGAGEPMDAAVDVALARRSDIRAQKIQVDQAEIGVMRAESDTLVNLELSATASYAGLDRNLGSTWSGSAASRRYGSYSVGLFLEVPIGNRAARARLERAVLQRSRSEADVRVLQNSAVVGVRNAWRDVESTRRQIDAAARAVANSQRQLEAEQERLRADKSTPFDVLLREEDLTRARLSHLRALVEFRSALAAYDFETGRILERRGLAAPAGAAGPAGR